MKRLLVALMVIGVAAGTITPMMVGAQDTNKYTLSGQVDLSNSLNGSVGQDVFVRITNQDGNGTYYPQVNQSGNYNASVPPGNYSVRLTYYSYNQTSNETEFAFNSVDTTIDDSDTDVGTTTLSPTEIKSKSLTITSGPGNESELGVSAYAMGGMMFVQVSDSPSGQAGGAPTELTNYNVTGDTTFELNITVTNFNPDSLMWMAKNTDWEVTETNNQNEYKITIETQATSGALAFPNNQGGTPDTPIGPLSLTRTDKSDFTWPDNVTADDGRDKVVYFGMFELSSMPSDRRENFKGMSVTTNAQTFSSPTYQNETLEFWLAAPSNRADGSQHTGFYHVKIPDKQVEEWGLDGQILSNESFDVRFKGEPVNFTVEDQDDGIKIYVNNITYSEGDAQIEPSSAATGDDGGGGGGGTGTFTTITIPGIGEVPLLHIGIFMFFIVLVAGYTYYKYYYKREMIYINNQ